MAFSIVLVYLLIVVNFQSWLDPFIILMALPAALAGIVWFLFITRTTVSVPALTSAWKRIPEYKVAYEQVLNTQPSVATAGAVAGALDQVETFIGNGLQAMSNGTSAATALASVVSQSNAAIASYNSRV